MVRSYLGAWNDCDDCSANVNDERGVFESPCRMVVQKTPRLQESPVDGFLVNKTVEAVSKIRCVGQNFVHDHNLKKLGTKKLDCGK